MNPYPEFKKDDKVEIIATLLERFHYRVLHLFSAPLPQYAKYRYFLEHIWAHEVRDDKGNLFLVVPKRLRKCE
jgi:hypothetical protein